jgi:hypothetical protein
MYLKYISFSLNQVQNGKAEVLTDQYLRQEEAMDC